ncbi:MAG: hypothetical protein LBR22_00825 [Desulfovibrio sp.]|jgi:hypothetical protein|nr:hypothetical protein [Desulfovibrio sp.]
MKHVFLLIVSLALFGCVTPKTAMQARPMNLVEFDVPTSVQKTIYNIKEKYRECTRVPPNLNVVMLDEVGYGELATPADTSNETRMRIELRKTEAGPTQVKIFTVSDDNSIAVLGAKGATGCVDETKVRKGGFGKHYRH